MARTSKYLQRRKEVINLQVLGFNVDKIAEKLGVHVNTISNDIQKINQEWEGSEEKKRLRAVDVMRMFEETKKRILTGAWLDVNKAGKIKDRNSTRRLILDAHEKQINAMVKLGLAGPTPIINDFTQNNTQINMYDKIVEIKEELKKVGEWKE